MKFVTVGYHASCEFRGMDFPIYRKYPNKKSFFKVISPNRFEELKLTGSKVELHVFEARIFLDHQLIQDMIDMCGGHWEESDEVEFTSVK